MQKFIENARCQFLDNGCLPFRESGGELSHGACQFLLAHLLCLPPQIADGIHHTERTQPALESLHLFGDDGLYTLDFLHAQANAFIDPGLDIIQIIHVYTGQRCHQWVYVSRECDIYKQ